MGTHCRHQLAVIGGAWLEGGRQTLVPIIAL